MHPHVPIPGQDPSRDDIELARTLQKIPPPNCFCGQPSRLKKVKRSHVNETSPAIGHYFFFCSKKKEDRPCRFAKLVQPHQGEQAKANKRPCSFFLRTGTCKKGENCTFSHTIQRAEGATVERHTNEEEANEKTPDNGELEQHINPTFGKKKAKRAKELDRELSEMKKDEELEPANEEGKSIESDDNSSTSNSSSSDDDPNDKTSHQGKEASASKKNRKANVSDSEEGSSGKDDSSDNSKDDECDDQLF